MKIAKVGWIVDVQNDFARSRAPGGRLYVRDLADESDPGAEAVEANVIRAVELLRDHCDAIVYTGDWHGMEDKEIDADSPDPARGTYPPHCMGRSSDREERRGAEIIAEIRRLNPLVLEPQASRERAREVAYMAVTERRPVFIQKTRFSVFEGNAATDEFLRSLKEVLGAERVEFFVLGHARDVCVTQFVDGVQDAARKSLGFHVVAISDATAGLGLEPEQETLARWEGSGGEVIRLSRLANRLQTFRA